jgi:hypothetical protein
MFNFTIRLCDHVKSYKLPDFDVNKQQRDAEGSVRSPYRTLLVLT